VEDFWKGAGETSLFLVGADDTLFQEGDLPISTKTQARETDWESGKKGKVL
jgi:hypothetical protein